MSREIDEKVVAIKFDNRQFEQNVDTTLKYVEELNKGLKFEGASKGLEKVSEASKDLDLSRFEKSVDSITAKIGVLETMMMTAVNRMTNAVIDFGKKTIDAFAIKPISTGFNEYELKMGSVQTIMAATGESVGVVNKYLDELNEYSDKTIYSFADMTNNIGKFTNAGVSLKDSVAAIKGISNEAALAGATANEASHAMYNFAQALSSGYVKLIDWKSIETANMATVQFKEELLKTAAEIGTVTKDASGMYKVLTTNGSGSSMKELINGTKNFNDSLAYQWMTTEVLTKTLAKYADEETELGKKAYAAAQDVKTFTMMVNTLSEAAQSGWAETWQLVVGDFEQAKKLFTTLTEFFSEIISNSAKTRNELIGNAMALQNSDGLSGREALWQSLLNIFTALRDVMGAVKDAFHDIFPPITDQRLRGIIESLYKFSEGLQQSDEKLQKIRATFRGIFAILDMFITIIRFTFRVATKVIGAFLTVLQTLAFAGFALLIQWIERVKTAETGFNGWVNNIGKGVKRFIDYIKTLDGFTLTNILKAMASFGSNVIGSIFNFKPLKAVFERFKEDVGFIFGKLSENAEYAGYRIQTAFGRLLAFLVAVKDRIIDILLSIKDKFDSGEISFGQIFAIAVGISLLLIIRVFTKFVSSMTEIAENIAEIFKRIGGVFKSISQKIKSEALWNLSKSIALIAASLALLTFLDTDKIYDSLIVLGLLVAGLVAASAAMSKIGSSKNSLGFAAVLIGMTVAIKAYVKAISQLQNMDLNSMKQPMIVLAEITGLMIAVSRLMGSKLGDGEKKSYAGITAFVGFAISLRMLVDTLAYIAHMDLAGISYAMKLMVEIAGVLSLVGIGFKNVKFGSGAAMIAAVFALKLVIGAIGELGQMDTTTVSNAMKSILKIFGMFALLMGVASIASRQLETFRESTKTGVKSGRKAASNVKDIGSAILKISASLLIVIGAIKLINLLSPDEIKKATGVILILMGVFAAVVAVSKFAGENADKAGTMIKKMTTSIAILAGVMVVLSLFSDPSVLKAPLAVLSTLLVVMGLVVAIAGLTSGGEHASKSIGVLTVAVIGLSTMVAVLSLIDGSKLKNATIAITLVLGAFSVVLLASKYAQKAHKLIITLTLAATAMAGLISLMSKWELNDAIQNATGVGILITALSTSMMILGKVDSFEKGVMTKVVAMTGVMALLTGVLGLLKVFNVSNSIENAVSIGVLIMALAASFKIMNGIDPVEWGAIAKLSVMAAIMAALGAVIGLLQGIGIQTSIQNAIALGVLLNALAASMVVLKVAGNVDFSMVGKFAIMAAIMAALGAVVGGLESIGIKVGIENALSLSILLVALSAACGLLTIAGAAAGPAIIGAGVLALVITALGLLMWGIGEVVRANPNIEGDLDLAIMVMGKIAEGLGALIGGFYKGVIDQIDFSIFERFGQGLSDFMTSLTPFFEGVKQVDDSTITNIGKLALSLLAITAAEVLDSISGWLNIFKGGNSMNTFSDELNVLGEGLVEFSKITANIENGDGVNNAVDILHKLVSVANSIPNSGGLLGLIVGNNDLDDFGNQFEALAKGIVTFCNKVKDIPKSDSFDYALDCITKLADLAHKIPNTGGLLGLIVGNNDMGPWAEQMPVLAKGVVDFCEKVKDIQVSKGINESYSVIENLTNLAKKIPNAGGLLWLIVGDNEMGPWAEQMPVVGEGVKAFCDATKGLDSSGVDGAMETLYRLSDLGHTIANSGGVAGFFAGENDLDMFGAQITWLGKYLHTYSTWIDAIKDMDKLKKSVEILAMIANVGLLAKNVDRDKFRKFGEVLVDFANNNMNEFIDVFEKADVSKIGTNLSERMIKSIKDTRTKFVTAGSYLVEGFLSGIKIKMSDKNALDNAGKELAERVLKAAEKAAEVASPSKRAYWIASMIRKGFLNGIADHMSDVENAGDAMANGFMKSVQDRLDIHSPSGWGEFIGNMTTNGIGQGLMNGASSLMSKFDGLWGQMQNLASNGIQGVKDIIGDYGIWDFGANIGDNLVNAKDKLKEWLGFGDVGGLSDLFGFGNLSDELEKEIEASYKGVQSGMGNLADKIKSGGAGSDIASNLSEALSIAMHKHFDSREFIYLGEQIGEDMAIAANNAIVSKTKALGSTFAEVVAVTAGGIDTWKAWAEDRKKYNELSVKDELAGWTLIQKMYKEGTKERMEADIEVYKLQQDLVKDTFEYSKKWIDNEKYYERLSLEEELAAWERVQKRYLEGSDERIEAEKEVYRIKKEIRQRDYEDAKKWIDKEKKYDRLSLAAELAAYKRIRATTEEGSDEREEMDEHIYELEKSIYEAQQQYIADVESAQKEAQEERIRLEEEYADKVKSINEKLMSDIQDLNDNYNNQVKQRAKELYKAYGLFDSVSDQDYDKDVLMENLQDQVRAFEDWRISIQKLSARGLDEALIKELTEMGPSAAGQIRALNEMTDAELEQYNLLWSEKSMLAREQAISELEYLRVETSDNIAKLQQESAKELDEYRKTWSDAMSKITSDCDAKLEELRVNFGETVGTIKKDTEKKMREMTETANQILREAGWEESGQEIVNGISSGIIKNSPKLFSTIAQIGLSALAALNAALMIKSPSKKTQWTGEMVGEGLLTGLASYSNKVNEAGYELGSQIQNGAFEAVKYVSNLLDKGMEVSPTFIPVIDLNNVRSGIGELNGMINNARAIQTASSASLSLEESKTLELRNPNEDVVKELRELRSDVGVLSDKMAKMQVILDTGTVVGELSGPLDSVLGDKLSRNIRERG